MVAEASAGEVVTDLVVVQVLVEVTVHICVTNGVKAMRLLILVQFVSFRGSLQQDPQRNTVPLKSHPFHQVSF